MTRGRLLALSAFWFGVNAHWGALLLVLVPSQVLAIVGPEEKGGSLGLVVGAGAFVALVLPPFFGLLSDRLACRFGRRRPFMVVGSLINLLGLAWMASSGSLGSLVGAFVLVELANNLATAPYLALVPDLVPPRQRGLASGYMGLMMVLGTIAGAAVAGALVDGRSPPALYAQQLGTTYLVVGALLLAGLVITACGIREQPGARGSRVKGRELLRSLWVDPRQYPDFAWAFGMRLLIMLGIYTVQQFLQYYLGDVIGTPLHLAGMTIATPEAGVTVLVSAILIGAASSTVVAGALSDRIGRTKVALAAAGGMSVVVLALLVVQRFDLALLLGLVFGLGYGAYMSTEMALVCDVLPAGDAAAKDLGIWHIAMVLPQVVAVPLAGPLLDSLNQIGKNYGYIAIFGLAVAYFSAGALCVRRIRSGGVRP